MRYNYAEYVQVSHFPSRLGQTAFRDWDLFTWDQSLNLTMSMCSAELSATSDLYSPDCTTAPAVQRDNAGSTACITPKEFLQWSSQVLRAESSCTAVPAPASIY